MANHYVVSCESPAAPQSWGVGRAKVQWEGTWPRSCGRYMVLARFPCSAEMTEDESLGEGTGELESLKCHVEGSLCLPYGCTHSLPDCTSKQPLFCQQKECRPSPNSHGYFDLGDQLPSQSCDDPTSQMPLDTSESSLPTPQPVSIAEL